MLFDSFELMINVLYFLSAEARFDLTSQVQMDKELHESNDQIVVCPRSVIIKLVLIEGV